MRFFAVVVLTVLLLAAPDASRPDSCSCAAAGASAICLDGGSAGEGVASALARPITLELRGGNSRQLSDALSRIAGKRIDFLPAKPDDAINLDVKDTAPWDVLEVLSRSGRVRIEGEDFSKLRAVRQALADGDKISVCIKGAPVAWVVNELSGLSGQAFRVTPGDKKALVTLSAKEITLEGILSRVFEQTGARIAAK